MGKTFTEIESEALVFPANQRAALARDLIASLDTELSDETEQAWLDEAERRYAAYQRGEISGRSAEQVIADLKGKYK